MLACCQLLVRQRGGNKVTGGEQLTSLPHLPICLCQPSLKSASIKKNLRSTKRIMHKKTLCWSKIYQEIWLLNSTHAPGKRLRPCMLRARFFFSFVFKGKQQTKIASTLAESHTVMLSTRKLNGRLNETLQSIRQPNYGEEMLQNDNVWIFHGFFLSCLARETVVKFNESVLTGFLSSIIIFYNIFMGFLWLRSIF